LTTP